MIREYRGIVLTIGAGLIAVVAIVGGVTITMNNNCQNAFWDTLLVYPDAELVSKQADFFGLQRVIYYTPDPDAIVNDWFRTERAAQMRAALDNLNLDLLPNQNWVVEGAVDREGSLLTLETLCP
ncbi:MAG: hypothetical protein IT319_19730 [Anaerolineae bacterium]|nr:hypothetical protein [Anaerolineae bacterium]